MALGRASRYYSEKQNLSPIRDYLEVHYTEKIVLNELADHFFISKFYLTRAFKEQYGVSINTYVLNIRIAKAKQKLRFTDKNWKILTTNVALGHHTISAAFLNRLRALRLQSSVKIGSRQENSRQRT